MKERTRILATAYDYRPKLGGVATCAYETVKALSSISDIEIMCIARDYSGAREFDRHDFFETSRIQLSERTPRATLEMSYAMSKVVHMWKPHAILNFLWLPCGAASLLSSAARVRHPIPYYTFAHGNELMESNRSLYKKVRQVLSPVKRSVFKNAAGVFAVSRYTAGLVSQVSGISEDRVEVVCNGVDTQNFFPESPSKYLQEKHKLSGKKVFLTVTRLEDYKGVDRAIGALRFVVERYPNVIYLVCGEGPDRSRLETLAKYHRVSDNVVFTGAVSFESLRNYYNLADCFILLSRLDEKAPNVEGFGIVFLEAAACGLPSIGGNSGGIPDAVEQNVSGWLVDPWDDRAIADAMLGVLDNPARAAEVGESARERAVNHFSWNSVAEKIWTRIKHDVWNRGSRT